MLLGCCRITPRSPAPLAQGDRCRRGPSASRGLPHPSPIALPLSLLAHPPSPIHAPPVAPFSQGGLRASKGPLPSGGPGEAGGTGEGPAWHPCLKDRSSTAHFLPQERWQRLGIMDDPSLTSPLHPSRPLPAAGGAVSGVAPPPGNAGGSKNRKLFQRTPSCSIYFKWEGGSLCPYTAPPPSRIFQECLAVASWLRPLCPPPPALRERALATHLCLGHALAGSWWKLTGLSPCSGEGGREERFEGGQPGMD